MVKEFVEYVVKSLVDQPDMVQVSCETVDGQYQVVVSVSQQDRGRVIGRNGETIRALRALVSVAAPDAGDIKVEIAE